VRIFAGEIMIYAKHRNSFIGVPLMAAFLFTSVRSHHPKYLHMFIN